MKIFEFELTRTELVRTRIAAETAEEAEAALGEFGIDEYVEDLDTTTDDWQIAGYDEVKEIDPHDKDVCELDLDGGVLNGTFYARGDDFIDAYIEVLGERGGQPDPNQLPMFPKGGKDK